MQAWKLRALTPQLSPASVVGFGSRGGGGGGQGECTSSPSGAGSYDNFDYVAPQTTGGHLQSPFQRQCMAGAKGQKCRCLGSSAPASPKSMPSGFSLYEVSA